MEFKTSANVALIFITGIKLINNVQMLILLLVTIYFRND